MTEQEAKGPARLEDIGDAGGAGAGGVEIPLRPGQVEVLAEVFDILKRVEAEAEARIADARTRFLQCATVAVQGAGDYKGAEVVGVRLEGERPALIIRPAGGAENGKA